MQMISVKVSVQLTSLVKTRIDKLSFLKFNFMHNFVFQLLTFVFL